jgi:Zn-dependent protease with chaperone function
VVTLAASPAALAVSRWQEREADRFALEITRDNAAAARTFVRLQEDNLAVPRTGLLYRVWRGSHPDLAERIEFANQYRPWATGAPLRYGDRFGAAEPPPGP